MEWRSRAPGREGLRREIAAALPPFLARGGCIRRLSPQRTPVRREARLSRPRYVPQARLFERRREPSELESWERDLRAYDPAEWERREAQVEAEAERQALRAAASRRYNADKAALDEGLRKAGANAARRREAHRELYHRHGRALGWM
jgi:hypothetical protein